MDQLDHLGWVDHRNYRIWTDRFQIRTTSARFAEWLDYALADYGLSKGTNAALCTQSQAPARTRGVFDVNSRTRIGDDRQQPVQSRNRELSGGRGPASERAQQRTHRLGTRPGIACHCRRQVPAAPNAPGTGHRASSSWPPYRGASLRMSDRDAGRYRHTASRRTRVPPHASRSLAEDRRQSRRARSPSPTSDWCRVETRWSRCRPSGRRASRGCEVGAGLR